MTKENLFNMIEAAGIIPVPVNREGDTEETFDHYAGDKLTDFLATAKSIGSKAVFVMEHILCEENFLYDLQDATDENDEEDSEEIDLSEMSPALARYKKRIGETYSFLLVAKGGAADLCFVLDQDWCADFENEIERAEGMAVLAQYKKK